MHYLRRVPILALLVVGVCILFLLVNYDQQKAVLEQRYRELTLEREKKIKLYSEIALDEAHKDLFDDIQEDLEKARNEKLLDFYILQVNGRALWLGAPDRLANKLEGKYPVGEIVQPNLSLITVDLGKGYMLTLGIEKNLDQYIADNADHLRRVTFEQSAHLLIIVLLVGLWVLKDLMLVVREVRRGKKGNLKNLKTKSKETQEFVRGLTGYAQALDDLQEENFKLGRQVLPSLRKEMFSGKKPPYDFHCTLVRTDINQFSTIYNTHNVTELMSTINEFFDEVSRIVARYGGLIHEFVGDEVIYYFKDEDHDNSLAIAASAVRDVGRAAERINAKTSPSRGYPFTVKSALAHGQVRFGPLVNGFTVAGSILIETVRILSYIHEREANVLYFDGRWAERLKDAILSHERQRVTLKGYQSEISLHEYQEHLGLIEILDDLNESTVHRLAYYRADEHIALIVGDLQRKASQRSLIVTLRALNILRSAHVTDAKIDFGNLLCEWIKELNTAFTEDAYPGVDKILSAVPMLMMSLVTRAGFTAQHRELIRTLLNCENRRVVANAVEVLTHFSEPLEKNVIRKLQSADLRTAANSLVLEGSEELSPTVLKKLRGFLSAKAPTEKASGLYALGELAVMHAERDPAYYAAHVEFHQLLQLLPTLIEHPASTVRRQALVAARKAADAGILHSIRQIITRSGSDLLQEELATYLDERAPSPNRLRKAS